MEGPKTRHTVTSSHFRSYSKDRQCPDVLVYNRCELMLGFRDVYLLSNRHAVQYSCTLTLAVADVEDVANSVGSDSSCLLPPAKACCSKTIP